MVNQVLAEMERLKHNGHVDKSISKTDRNHDLLHPLPVGKISRNDRYISIKAAKTAKSPDVKNQYKKIELLLKHEDELAKKAEEQSKKESKKLEKLKKALKKLQRDQEQK